jgi:predicted restriction endonuclease
MRASGFAAMTEPGCVMARENHKELFSEIEQAQDELRESIDHSRRLVERSDALIRQVRDQADDPGEGAQSPG